MLLADTQENLTYMTKNYHELQDKRLLLIEKKRVHQLKIDEIVYIECVNHLVLVYLINKTQPDHYSISLTSIENELSNSGFLRINHNRLINMKYVVEIIVKNHEVKLNDEKIFTVSRRKWHRVRFYFKNI